MRPGRTSGRGVAPRHFVGFRSKVPAAPSIRVGVYPAFSTASHIAFGDGVAPYFAVTVRVFVFTSATADSTPSTADTALPTVFAHPAHDIPSTVIFVAAASAFAGCPGWSAAQHPAPQQPAFRSAFGCGAGAASARMVIRSQHPAPAAQHGEPGAQQSSAQHGEPGKQQSAPGAQHPAPLAAVSQHGEPGAQQAAPVAQQSPASQHGEPGKQQSAPGEQHPVRDSVRDNPTPASPSRAASPKIAFATIVQSSGNTGRVRPVCFW